MKLLLCSQISTVRHTMRELWLSLVPLELSVTDKLTEMLKPYQPQAQQKGLRVVLKFNNPISSAICTNWQIYAEILFHILQNAFKFSKRNGEIHITVNYCQLAYLRNDLQD